MSPLTEACEGKGAHREAPLACTIRYPWAGSERGEALLSVIVPVEWCRYIKCRINWDLGFWSGDRIKEQSGHSVKI